MPTKKVTRKRRTHSVRYRRDDEEYYKPKPEYGDIKVFGNLLSRAKDKTLDEWEDADNIDKQKMMLEYIRTYGAKSNFANKYRNRYFPDGKPNYNKFRNEVLLSDYVKSSNFNNGSKTAKAVRGLFVKRYKDEIEDSQYYKNALPSLKEKFLKKFFKESEDITDRIYDKEMSLIKRREFKTKLTPKTQKIIKKFSGKGSEADQYQDVLNNPKEFIARLQSEVAVGNLSKREASDHYKRIFGDKPDEEIWSAKEMPTEPYKFNTTKASRISAALNYSHNDIKTMKKKQPLTMALEHHIRNDSQLNALPIEEAITKLDGRKIKWNEIIAFNEGKSLSVNPILKHAKEIGIEVTDLPRGKVFTKKSKSKSLGYKSSGGGGSGFSTSRGRTASSSSWFGSSSATMTPSGDVKVRKEKGKISKTLGKAKDKTWGRIHPSPNQRARDYEKKYKGHMPQEMLDQGKTYMQKTKGPVGWLQRRLKDREAKRMAIDPNYKAKKRQEFELDKGIQAAKILKAQKEAKAITRAATSPWYGAYYRFSKYTKWIALTAILVAILFIPMGMFYVLGWALAVAVVALFQFIVWVFMEIWLLLAQVVVAIVGLVGQTVTMFINWIGGGVGGVLNQDYKPFEHQLVRDMLMFERDSAGNWVVYTFTDTGGKTQLLTWGALNLTPPSFLKLDLFKPTTFDTDTIIAKIIPPLTDFFRWLYSPIAERYTGWISDPLTPWYWPGVIIGIPAVLIVVGIIILWRYMKRKYQMA